MKTIERVVTPSLAKLLLEKNTSNRNINKNLVATYARDMINGDWMNNGETIKVSTSGVLIDGQHRLHAVIQSGESVKMLIVEGLPENAFRTVDVGMRRTAGQQLAIASMKNATASAAIARWVVVIEEQIQNDRVKQVVTMPEIFDAIERHPLISKYATRHSAGKLKFLVPTCSMAPMVLAAEKYGEDLVDQFVNDLDTGEGTSKGDPAFEFRERMITNRGSVAKLRTETIVLFAMKAISAFCNGRKIGVLRIMAKEGFPSL